MKRIVQTALVVCISLLLLFTGAASAYENAGTNGGFTNGLTGWSEHTYAPNSDSNARILESQDVVELGVSVYNTYGTAEASISQSVDFAGVSSIQINFAENAYYSHSNRGLFNVYIDNTVVASYTPSQCTAGIKTIDVSSYADTGIHVLKCEAEIRDKDGAAPARTLKVYLDGVYAYTLSPYTVTDISLTPAEPNAGTPAQISFTYSGGDPAFAEGQQSINFNAGGSTYQVDLYGKTSPVTVSYTFPNSGTQSIYAYGVGPQSTSSSYSEAFTILPAKPAGLSLTSTPADGIIEVGSSITFVASASSGGSVTSWTWDFGDGSAPQTTTSATATHTYTETGTYDVIITANGPGGSTTYTKENAVYVGETSVTLNKSPAIYYIGEDTEIIANYSITPFDSGKVYTMEFWKLNADYSLNSRVVSIPLSSSSGSESIPITSITTNSYYAVYLVVDGGQIAGQTLTVRYDGATLTVNILSGNAPLQAATTVTLSSGGTIIENKTTNTGSVVFAPVTEGQTYQVSANATGYNPVTATVTISGDTTVDLDVGGVIISGIGAEYEPITATWTFYNQNGGLLPGVSVSIIGIEQSTSIGFLNSLYNMVFGEQLIGQAQTLTTDSRGQVTFIVLPNVQYKLTYSYGGQTYEKTYNIGSTKPFYTVTINTQIQSGDITKDVTVSVEGVAGTIKVNYTDSTSTTSLVKITILNSDRQQIDTWSAPTQQADISFQLSNYAGKEYFVIVEATNAHGTYEREFPLWFNGPRLDIGIPDGLLIWVALISTCAIGAIFSTFNVPMGAMATSIYMWIMFAIGWLWQMEEIMGTASLVFTLTLASLISIMFMMAEGR